jgi:uncharacterized protein
MRVRSLWLIAVILVLLTPGVVVVAPARGQEVPLPADSCTDPCALFETRVPMSDGVELHGWIYVPDVRVNAPVVLWSSIYFGTLYPSANDPEIRDNSSALEPVPVNLLLKHGYAVAAFNVRGTGHSGGCVNWHGPREQRDHYELIEWLGDQDWSNGRVGMMGQSYDGGTTIGAASTNPPSLKTFVVAANVSDWYLVEHSPQGGYKPQDPPYQTAFIAGNSVVPPVRSGANFPLGEWLAAAGDRLCPEAQRVIQAGFNNLAFDRDESFYAERRFTQALADVRASAFITHGFGDCGHCWQEDVIWQALKRAPKRMILGPWGHNYPNYGTMSHEEWNAELIRWLDFWLKGIGEGVPGLGTVRYQDYARTWRTSTSWPPAEARDEVMYLGLDGLAAAPALGSRSFIAAQLPPDGASTRATDLHVGTSALCPGLETFGAAYLSAPLSSQLVLAGNPFAYLKISASEPGGIVAASLVDLPPGAGCISGLSDHRVLSFGSADLRHHAGNLDDRPFAVNQTQSVRIDMLNLAETVPAGHRLALVLHGGLPYHFGYEPRFHPTITVQGAMDSSASQVVLPLVEGTFGGSKAKRIYPTRPFGPTSGGGS